MQYKIVLASNSPRRKELLKRLNITFEIEASNYDEVITTDVFDYAIIENLAYNKALDVAKRQTTPTLVIGADTVVVNNNKIIGKPKDKTDAYNILKSLSNKEHFVVTSICVINSETMEKKIVSTTSYVTFNELSDELIYEYIKNKKPFDKAGSYGIQELPQAFVKNVHGSFENIIGMCPVACKQALEHFIH